MGKIMFNYQFTINLLLFLFMTILTQILTHYFQVSLELKQQQLLLTLSCSAMSLSGVVENINFCSVAGTACLLYCLETVLEFLIQLGIKPSMHLLEISIFSLNYTIVRPTKIMNRADKNWAHFQKIKYFKNQSFQKISFVKVVLLV